MNKINVYLKYFTIFLFLRKIIFPNLRIIEFLFIHLIICAFITELFAVKTANANLLILKNENVSFRLEKNTNSENFAAVMAIEEMANDNSINTTLFKLLYNNQPAGKNSLTSFSDSSASFTLENFPNSTFKAKLNYKLGTNKLKLVAKIWSNNIESFSKDLEFLFEAKVDSIKASSTPENKTVYSLLNSEPTFDHHNNDYTFYHQKNSFKLFIPNPFHAYLNMNKYGNHQHSLDILNRLPSNGEKNAPQAHSLLKANDTIFRYFEISLTNNASSPVVFSQFPNGFENGITMFWDELPNNDNWGFMTTENATNLRYDHFFVRLLNEHPNLKMGYLLLLNRQLTRWISAFQSWELNSPFIIADSLDKYDYGSSILMQSPRNDTLFISQSIRCDPNTNFNLSYWSKLKNVFGHGVFFEIYGQDSKSGTYLIQSGRPHSGTRDWYNNSFNFKAGINDTGITIKLKLENATGDVFFDKVEIKKIGNNINRLNNGSFESHFSQIMYTHKRRLWPDAIGKFHFLPSAPLEYLNFLKRIENDKLRYGWENRVRLGSHGFHHTPNYYEAGNLPGVNHEFFYYDPYKDSITIHQVFRYTGDIGLTNKSLKYFRAPGNKFTESIINLLIDSGFVYMDAGGGKSKYSSQFIQRLGNRIWASKNNYWCDIDIGHPDSWIMDVMKQGHLVQLGGHPGDMFKNSEEQYYLKFHNLFSNLETQFPHLGYFFPDEWANYANQIYELQISDISNSKDLISVQFMGSLNSGASLAVNGKINQAVINGNPLTIFPRENKTMLVLPELPMGYHKLDLKGFKNFEKNINEIEVSPKVKEFSIYPNPFYPITTLFFPNNSQNIEISIYNILGKPVLKLEKFIYTKYKWDASILPSGVYQIMLRSNNSISTKQIILLK